MHESLEKFKSWLKDNAEFNSSIQERLIRLKGMTAQGINCSSSDRLFAFELGLDMISISDSDFVTAQFISSCYPFLEEIVCEYVFGYLSEECEMLGLSRHRIRASISIRNDFFSNSLSEYRQLELLSAQLRTRESIAGELSSFPSFRILQLFPESTYSSLRIFEGECACSQTSVVVPRKSGGAVKAFTIKNNLITHFCEKQPIGIANCKLCNSPRIEDQSKRVIERYQQALVFIPSMRHSDSKGIYTMYIEGIYCSALIVNSWYSCLAYYAVQPLAGTSKMASSSCLISEYQEVSVKEFLFALRVSPEAKTKNIAFAERIIDAIQNAQLFLIQDDSESENHQQQQQHRGGGGGGGGKQNPSQDSDPNFHFRFKQLAFACEVVFSDLRIGSSSLSRFACLHAKIALILSYVCNNQTHLLGFWNSSSDDSSIGEGAASQMESNALHVQLSCSHAFYEKVADLVESVFGQLEDCLVYDARSDCDFMSVLVQVGSGILLVRHAEALSKRSMEVMNQVLTKQSISFDKLKTSLVLPVTIWSLVEATENSKESKIRKGKRGAHAGMKESHFDIVLRFDDEVLISKDYCLMLSLFAESYSKDERDNERMKESLVKVNARSSGEMQLQSEGYYSMGCSPKRKEQRKQGREYYEDIGSTLRKKQAIVSTEKLHRVRRESAPKAMIANEGQAFELMGSFVNTARANSQQRGNRAYSMSNAKQVSKVARSTALFTQIFVNQAEAETWMLSEGSTRKRRVAIDVFDAFIGIFFNVLSRDLFDPLIDKSYLMSFIANYGIGYQDNQAFVNDQFR